MTSHQDSKEPWQCSPSGHHSDYAPRSPIVGHPGPAGNTGETVDCGNIVVERVNQQQDSLSAFASSGHVLQLVESDGRKSRKRPLDRSSSEEPGQRLPTSRHDEVDIITSRTPTGGRGITDIHKFGPEFHNDAKKLIAESIDFGQCAESKSGSTIGTKGKVRLDNQGDVYEGDKRSANLQVQIKNCTVAAAEVEIGPEFGSKRIRRALNESLEKQTVQKLSRSMDSRREKRDRKHR